MKVFAFTVVLLALLLLLVTVNAVYVHRVTGNLLLRLEQLPDLHEESCLADAQSMLVEWELHVDRMGLSVSFCAVDRVTEQMKLLVSCAESQDLFGFRSARTLLADALQDVARLEVVDIGSLF